MKLKLSVLDQTPIRRGSTASEALQESVELIKLAESHGYSRYWISEHHNFASLAAAAPEVLLARLGAEARRIRIGSGGIMLPNHSALKVAENFRLLEALYPGRIDLGIGRAPGGDRVTASLLNPSNTFEPNDYIEQINSLRSFLNDDRTKGTVHEKVKAIPIIESQPEMWMLTSSGESAYLAAHFGIALSFAAFINPTGGPEAIEAYRRLFKPSPQLSTPKASVGIFAFCGETEEKAERMQTIMDYRLLSMAKGSADLTPDYETSKAYKYSEQEWRMVLYNRQRMIIGTQEEVRVKIEEIVSLYEVDEIILATFSETKEDRLKSYEMFADLITREQLAGK